MDTEPPRLSRKLLSGEGAGIVTKSENDNPAATSDRIHAANALQGFVALFFHERRPAFGGRN